MPITFEYLRKLQQDEESNKYSLQKINNNFYSELKKYIIKIENEYTQEEKENIKSIIDKIFKLRLDKLIKIAKLSLNAEMNVDNCTQIEKDFINELKELILKYQKIIENKICIDKNNCEKKDNRVKAKFIEDVFSFVMDDMKAYGPYKKGEICSLEKKAAELLLKNKKIKIID